MRRIFLLCFILISIYAVYHDVTKGSLPQKNTNNQTTTSKTKDVFQDSSYYLQEVQPGDTVIGIVEKNEKSMPASIEKIISDFKNLNDGMEPQKIKIGHTYKFKRYNQSNLNKDTQKK